MSEETYKTYRHAPAHLFRPGAVYMITASTHRKLPHMRGAGRKRQWRASLAFVVRREQWELLA